MQVSILYINDCVTDVNRIQLQCHAKDMNTNEVSLETPTVSNQEIKRLCCEDRYSMSEIQNR